MDMVWDGFAKEVKGCGTAHEALGMADMDWGVMLAPVEIAGCTVQGEYGVLRSDGSHCFGLVKGRYTPVCNVDAFAFVDVLLEEGWSTAYAGSLRDGGRCFLVLEREEQMMHGVRVKPYLFASTSHDGTSPLMAGMALVDADTGGALQFDSKRAPRTWRFKHTLNIDPHSMGERVSASAQAYLEYVDGAMDAMKRTEVDGAVFLDRLMTANPTRMAQKNMPKVASMVRSIHSGLETGSTALGWFRAVCAFSTRGTAFRRTKTFMENRVDGFLDGYPTVEEAYGILMDMLPFVHIGG